MSGSRSRKSRKRMNYDSNEMEGITLHILTWLVSGEKNTLSSTEAKDTLFWIILICIRCFIFMRILMTLKNRQGLSIYFSRESTDKLKEVIARLSIRLSSSSDNQLVMTWFKMNKKIWAEETRARSSDDDRVWGSADDGGVKNRVNYLQSISFRLASCHVLLMVVVLQQQDIKI